MTMIIRLHLPNAVTLDNLAGHPIIRSMTSVQPKHQQVTDVYYDTPSLKLYKQGIELKLRQEKGQQAWQQCLAISAAQKTSDTKQKKGGSHTKIKLQKNCTKISHPVIDFTKLGKIIDSVGIKSKSLEPIFNLECARYVWQLCVSDGSRFDILLENGKISSTTSSTITELSLVFIKGDLERWYQLALALTYDFSASLEFTSFIERGISLRNEQFFASTPLKTLQSCDYSATHKVKSNPADDIETTFVSINENLVEYLSNSQKAFALAINNPENLNAMCYAVQSLRASLDCYHTIIPHDNLAELDDELRWFFDELQLARNWNCFFLDNLTPFIAHFSNYPELEMMSTNAEQQRQKALEQVAKSLRSQRYARLYLGLRYWLVSCGWHEAMDAHQKQHLKQKTGVYAKKVLGDYRRAFAVLPFAKHASDDGLKQDTLKQTTLALARLRDASNFFASCYSGSSHTKSFITVLTDFLNKLELYVGVKQAEHLFPLIINSKQDTLHYLVEGWLGAKDKSGLIAIQDARSAFLRHPLFWE